MRPGVASLIKPGFHPGLKAVVRNAKNRPERPELRCHLNRSMQRTAESALARFDAAQNRESGGRVSVIDARSVILSAHSDSLG